MLDVGIFEGRLLSEDVMRMRVCIHLKKNIIIAYTFDNYPNQRSSISKKRRIVQDLIRLSYKLTFTFQSSKIMYHEAKTEKNTEVKVKDQASKSIVQKQKLPMIVQPGDAQRHMLNALSEEKNEAHDYNPYDFLQMNAALTTEHIHQQQPYLYSPYFSNTQASQNAQESTYSQGHFQEFIPQPQSYHNRGFYHRGRGRHHGKHQDNFCQYRPLPQNYPYHENYPYPPQFHGFPPQSIPPYQYGVEYNQHCQNAVKMHPQSSIQSCQTGYSGYGPIKEKKRQKNLWKKEDKGYNHAKWKNKNRSRSKSSSSSDENEDDESYSMKKKYNEEISEFYNKKLKDFFEKKQIKEPQREKIMRVLMKRFPRFDAPIQKILKTVDYLQSQNLLFHLAYAKVIKVSLNNNFDFNAIVPRLTQIQEKKIKKLQSDQIIKSTYGQEIEPMIDHHVLINQKSSNVVYLVDGNNIMPAVKHFRHYFQSQDHREKLETQIRLRFFISIALPPENVCLFFDQKFNEEEAKQIQDDWLLTNSQRERYYKVPVVYGQTEIADQKIVKKVRQLSDRGSEQELILVSSDRQLFMRCKQIMNLSHTGGKFFFKFLKFKAKEVCKGDKQGKRTVKAILHGIQ